MIASMMFSDGVGCTTNEHVNHVSQMPLTNAYSDELAGRTDQARVLNTWLSCPYRLLVELQKFQNDRLRLQL